MPGAGWGGSQAGLEGWAGFLTGRGLEIRKNKELRNHVRQGQWGTPVFRVLLKWVLVLQEWFPCSRRHSGQSRPPPTWPPRHDGAGMVMT